MTRFWRIGNELVKYGDQIVVDTSPTGATGGTVTYDGRYKIHTFDSSGTDTFTVITEIDCSILVVGGGGAGGTVSGGIQTSGGGGGGEVIEASRTLIPASYIVSVGGGGDKVSPGKDGIDSSIYDLTASKGFAPDVLGDGGDSGGGFSGGAGGDTYTGGGGAGSTQNGDGGTPTDGGDGGAGVTSSISGISLGYGGGGGGGADGPGVPGDGEDGGGDGIASNGTRGGGGGGRTRFPPNATGGKGGTGIVIIRYKYK